MSVVHNGNGPEVTRVRREPATNGTEVVRLLRELFERHGVGLTLDDAREHLRDQGHEITDAQFYGVRTQHKLRTSGPAQPRSASPTIPGVPTRPGAPVGVPERGLTEEAERRCDALADFVRFACAVEAVGGVRRARELLDHLASMPGREESR
jgi:hypothetical protein